MAEDVPKTKRRGGPSGKSRRDRYGAMKGKPLPEDFDPLEKRRCSATSKTTGEQCRQNAIQGGVVCRFHGGGSPVVRARASERVAEAEARRRVERLGEKLQCSPDEALQLALEYTAGAVEFMAGELVGTPDGEAPDGALAQLYALERQRLAAIAKQALDVGLAERMVRLEEDHFRLAMAVVSGVVDGLGLSVEQRRRVPGVVRSVLESMPEARALAAGEPEPVPVRGVELL